MSVVISVGLTVLAGVLALYLYLRRLHSVVIPDTVKAPHFVPGAEPHLFWGSLGPLRETTGQEDLFAQMMDTYLKDTKLKVRRLHLLFVPSVVLFDPRHVRRVIAQDNFPKGVVYSLLRNFLGDGLLLSAGTK